MTFRTKLEALTYLARTVAASNTEYGDLEAMAREVLAMPDDPAPRVLISVSGGVAEFETHGGVDVELIDFDNLEAEGLDRDEREEKYQEGKHWLETGELSDDDEADPPCRNCGGPTDDGEGWDGYCGNCADAFENMRQRAGKGEL